ncbi:MAG: peroxiredoxin family protein, partial [Halobacteriaceae archaeon]
VFRGDWCSYCTEQLQTFSALEYDLWRHLDATVLPVAGDALPRLRAMRDRYGFGMQLLSDPELSMAEWTGIEHNDDHGDILVPGTFIVDTEGMVRYEHVGDNPADRTYANYVRAAIRSHDCRDPYPPGERDRF